MSELGPYERQVLAEINAFKNPPKGALRRTIDSISETKVGRTFTLGAKAAGQLLEPITEPVAGAIGKATNGILDVINDGASWSVRVPAILEEYRKDGHAQVHVLDDIHSLQIQAADRTVGYLAAKYKTCGATTGAAAGALGMVGMIPEIPVFVGLSLRAVSEYASYYGFDLQTQSERAFALQVLGAGSASNAVEKSVALAELSRTAAAIGSRKTWDELNKIAFVRLAQQVAKMLGLRLTKKALSAAIPLIGAGMGAGMNAWFISSVTEAAYMTYRERFLIRKYGPGVAVSVQTFEP